MNESRINCSEGASSLYIRRALPDFPSVTPLVSLPTLGRLFAANLALCKARAAVRLGSRARIWALAAALQPCTTNRCSLNAVEAASHCSGAALPHREQRLRSAATKAPQR